ncbi:MAG: RyR domain-containing protein [Anaerolineae bacterium]|nr:RyR domain-containing protein [Anaerolineae bacterium]
MTRPSDKGRVRGRRALWLAIGALWVAGLGLGYSGFVDNARSLNRAATPLDIAYKTLQLVTIESGAPSEGQITWALNTARFLIPLLAAWTAIRALLSLFRDRWQQAALRFRRDHVIVCGLSRKGWLLAQGFARRGDRVVVIEQNEAHDLIGTCREHGIVVLVGDATQPDLLRRAGVERARHLVAVTDDDGANAEIAVRCQDLLRAARRSYPLTCTVHLVDPRLHELARTRELALEDGVPMRLELFNIFDRGARLLWGRFGPPDVLPDPVAPPSTAKVSDHVLVIGLGRLGDSLVTHAARDWHSRLHATPRRAAGRLRITVIDLYAESKCRTVSLRYPQLASVCDLVPLTLNVHGPEFFEAAYLAASDKAPAVSAVFVCFDDDSLALRTGLVIHQRIRQTLAGALPVVVRMTETGGLARLVDPDGDGTGAFANLHAFGLVDQTCTPETILGGTHEVLARGLHEAYVQQQQALGHTEASNPSLRPWDGLPERLRESNRARADSVLHHLTALGYTLAPLTDWEAASFRLTEPEVAYLAEREHERFVAERQAQGWRYGAGPKNEALRRNPALVPWPDLAQDERTKTCEAVRELPRTLAGAGFQIVRQAPPSPGAPPGGARREILGRAIHERYRVNQQGAKPPDDPAMQPWDLLSEALREANRRQGDDIERTLHVIGCGVRPAAGDGPTPFAFSDGEVEAMGAVTHEHWVEGRLATGWTAGPERDVSRQITPYLVPYEQLPDEAKEWDRQAVRAIPEVLAAAGLEVYRIG